MISFFQRSVHVVVAATLVASFYLYCTEEPMIGQIGGFTLHVTDLLFALAACYCIVGALIQWHLSLEVVALAAYGLPLINFLRGVLEWGYAPAGVEYRVVALFTALLFYVYFWARRLDVDWIFKAITWLGWGIVALSLARLAFGLTLFIIQYRDPTYEFRTLNSDAAMMLGMAALIAFHGMIYKATDARMLWYGSSFAAFIVALFVSNQRTSTFATLAGLLVLIATVPTRFRPIVVGGAIALTTIAGMFLTAMWSDLGGDLTDYLPNSINMIILGSETYGAREALWQSYLYIYSTLPFLDQLVGQPYGASYLLTLQNGNYISVSPHNGYIALLINAGAIGAFLFASVLVVAIVRGLIAINVAKGANAQYLRLAIAIIATSAVYSYGYQLGNEQGLLFGIAIFFIERAMGSRRAVTLDRTAKVKPRLKVAAMRAGRLIPRPR